MILKSVFSVLVLGLLLSLGWHYRAAWLDAWRVPAPMRSSSPESLRVVRWERPLQEAAALATHVVSRARHHNKPSSTVHKCRQDERVIYTDEHCPADALEQPMHGGTLSFFPSGARPGNTAADDYAAAGAERPLRLAPSQAQPVRFARVDPAFD